MHTCDTESLSVDMGVLARVGVGKKSWCVAKAERSEGQLDARGVGALLGV